VIKGKSAWRSGLEVLNRDIKINPFDVTFRNSRSAIEVLEQSATIPISQKLDLLLRPEENDDEILKFLQPTGITRDRKYSLFDVSFGDTPRQAVDPPTDDYWAKVSAYFGGEEKVPIRSSRPMSGVGHSRASSSSSARGERSGGPEFTVGRIHRSPPGSAQSSRSTAAATAAAAAAAEGSLHSNPMDVNAPVGAVEARSSMSRKSNFGVLDDAERGYYESFVFPVIGGSNVDEFGNHAMFQSSPSRDRVVTDKPRSSSRDKLDLDIWEIFENL